MIKRFIQRVFGLKQAGPIRMPKGKHGLARESISPAALRVCEGLAERGPIVGATLVEYVPGNDPTGLGGKAAARLLCNLISAIGARGG